MSLALASGSASPADKSGVAPPAWLIAARLAGKAPRIIDVSWPKDGAA